VVMTNLNVVHFISKLSFYGGTTRKYLAWVNEASKTKHHFILYEGNKQIREMAEVFIEKGAKISILKRSNIFWQLIESVRLVKRYNKVCVLGHHFRGAFLAACTAKLLRIPFLIPLHGPASVFSPCKLSIYKIILRIATRVVYNSNFTASTFNKLGNNKIVYNGITYTSIPVKSEFEPYIKIRLLSIGTLVGLKNHKMLINMMNYLDDRFHLIIIGEGDERANLENMIKSHRLEGRVELAGQLYEAQRIMNQADILLHPSFVESFGMAVLEALYAQLPVVVSDCCAPMEIIQNGKFGWFASPKDPMQWARTVMTIIEHPSVAWNKAVEGRKWALQMYSDKNFARQMDELMCDLLECY
jgi:L-malate glycosyltransferase